MEKPNFSHDFEKPKHSDETSAMNAGLKRRGLEPLKEKTEPPVVEKKGDAKTRLEVANERAARLLQEERREQEEATRETRAATEDVAKRMGEYYKKPADNVDENVPADVVIKLDAPTSVRSTYPVRPGAGRVIKPEASAEDRAEKKERPKSRLDWLLNSRAAKLITAGILAGFLAYLASGEKPKSSEDPNAGKSPKAKVSDRIPMTEKETVKTTKGQQGLHGHWTFYGRDEAGREGFNLWAMVAPVQVEWSGETKTEKEKTVKVPYEYARLFEHDPVAGKPLRAEDREKMSIFVQEEMKRKFTDTLSMWSKDVNRYHHGEPGSRPSKITSIRITGFASPEGPRAAGPETLLPGNVDPENVRLAEKRAGSMVSFTDVELERLSKETGIDMGVIREAIKNIDAKEDQFSKQELQELANLALSTNGSDDAERIYNLVADYNDGQLEDASVISKLDEIVGAKRRVEIVAISEGNEKSTWLIPLPLLLLGALAFPALRRWRRNNGEDNQNRLERPPFNGTPQPEVTPNNYRVDQVPALIKEINLPERSTPEFMDMEERVLIDDLYVFFNDEEAIRRGIDYRLMADRMYTDFDSFKGNGDRELALTNEILEAWQKHDYQCRVEAGVSADELANGLNYKEQPEQIKWARMHARGLLLLIEERKDLSGQGRGERDYLELLSPRVGRLQDRRAERENLVVI